VTVSPREPRTDDPNRLLQGGLALLDRRVGQPQLLELTGHIAEASPEHQATVGDGVDVGGHASQQDRVPIGDAAHMGPQPDGPRHRGQSG
jgi:hypothetical protein